MIVDGEEYLTVKQMAVRLGISWQQVYNRFAKLHLTRYKPRLSMKNNGCYYKVADVEKAMKEAMATLERVEKTEGVHESCN